jgi:hypothetical protein
MSQHTSRAQQFVTSHTDFLSHADTSDPPNTECPVCLDGIEDHICVKIVNVRGCKHLIGLECLEKMLNHRSNDKKECPMCRTMWIPEDSAWEDDPPLGSRGVMASGRPVQHQPSAPSARTTRYHAYVARTRPGHDRAYTPSTRSGYDQAYAPSACPTHHQGSSSQAWSRVPHPNGGGRPDLIMADGVTYEWTDDDAASVQANASLTPAEQQRIAYLDSLGPQGGSSRHCGAPQQHNGMRPSAYESSSRQSGYRPSRQTAAEYYPQSRQPDARSSRQPGASEIRRSESRRPEHHSSRHTESHPSRLPDHRSSHHHDSCFSRHTATTRDYRPSHHPFHHYTSSPLPETHPSRPHVFSSHHPGVFRNALPQLGIGTHGSTRTPSSTRRPTDEAGSRHPHHGDGREEGSLDDRRGAGTFGRF